jgi:hypothetical protein
MDTMMKDKCKGRAAETRYDKRGSSRASLVSPPIRRLTHGVLQLKAIVAIPLDKVRRELLQERRMMETDVDCQRSLVKTLLLFLVLQEVDGVLLHVLPPVVVAHDGLRVAVLTHHLHLPVGHPRVQRLGDGGPAQVVRRHAA